MRDCVTSIKLPSDVINQFENIGDVLIPFFFKEEYADRDGFYNTIWRNPDEQEVQQDATTDSSVEKNKADTTATQETSSENANQENSSDSGSENGGDQMEEINNQI